MTHRLVPTRLILYGIAAAAWPGFAVLLVLVLTGALAIEIALPAALAIAGLLWWPIRHHYHELARLANRLNDMGTEADDDREPERLHINSPLVTWRIAAALTDAASSWQHRFRQLSERHSSSESVIEHLPDPVIAIDSDCRIVRATSGANAVFDSNPVGSDLATVLRDPGVLEAADRVIRTGQAEQIDFIGGPRSDTALAARIVGLAVPAADGTKAVIAVSDVTAARRIERTRADFIANASHELRTPLSVLLGCIQTLRGAAREDAEARERFLAMMEDQAERMNRLVADLLSLSEIELSEHQAHSEAVALMPVIGQVCDALQFAARSRGISIETECALDAPSVIGERDELTQLFQNLIDNAIKYGGEGSCVRVSVGPGRLDDADAIVVAVSDQGEGIAEEHLPRLTERFYRIDTARSREMGGTGLGLAIVKHIISRHRGRLTIGSEHGTGSTFRVTLPAAAQGPPQTVINP